MLRDCQTGGKIERLGACAYRGSRRRLRHSISAVGPKIPYTKKRPLGLVRFASRQRRSHQLAGSGDFLPPPPPAEKASTSQNQDTARQLLCCEDRPQLLMALTAPRLRTLQRAEDIGSALKGAVNVWARTCQRSARASCYGGRLQFWPRGRDTLSAQL